MIPQLDFEGQAFLTVLVITIFTSMAVTAFIKPAVIGFKKRKRQKYILMLHSFALLVALLFAGIGLIAADVWSDITPALIAQTFFRGFASFFLAVFGYKGYNGLLKRITGEQNGQVR